MAEEPEQQRVRRLTLGRDHDSLIAWLDTDWPEDNLQLVGDGLLSALLAGVAAAQAPARRCVAALRERAWLGDTELADALEARLGTVTAARLEPLVVDLEELSSILEGDPVYGGGQIDLTTGEIWHRSTLEDGFADDIEDLDLDDDERWLPVACEGSREGYRDMEIFIGRVGDPVLADRLEIAIMGRGAFRRFKDVLARSPEWWESWHAFSDDRHRGRAREWLAAAGYEVRRPY